MPKATPDHNLLEAIESVVRNADGNESEAARRLGLSRLKINRVRKQRGAVTPAVRNDLWRRLEQISVDPQRPAINDTRDTKTIQIVRDVPSVALQVLRYMTEAIERDASPEGRSNVL